MPVINLSKRTWIVSKVDQADSLMGRIIGWIGRRTIDPECALWVRPCWGIHTFGMNFPVDVLFLERDHLVVEQLPNFPTNRISPFIFRAKSVLVLPVNSIEKSQTNIGDRIDITP
jgi:uncharacterized membrane protein (UPF0127 family)